MLIARTDWDVPKHRGISFFFCPMKQPGVEVRPLRQITDESHFNEVFLTDAIVPAENLLGALGAGWGVLQTALAYERSVMGEGARGPRSGVPEAVGEEPLIALAREAGVLGDPVIRQEIAKAIAYKKLNALNNARAKADLGQGHVVVDHEPRQAGDEPHPARGSAGADPDPGRGLPARGQGLPPRRRRPTS